MMGFLKYSVSVIVILITIISCGEVEPTKFTSPKAIVLYQLGGDSTTTLDSATSYLAKVYPTVQLLKLDAKQLPDSVYNSSNKVMGAVFVNYLKSIQRLNQPNIIIAITDKLVSFDSGLLSGASKIHGFGSSTYQLGFVSTYHMKHMNNLPIALRNTILHELGHIIGIKNHCTDTLCLMRKGEEDLLKTNTLHLCKSCKLVYKNAGFSFPQ